MKDGIDFMNRDNVIAVNGEGQPSINGFESFISQFSDFVGKEINGYYLSENDQESISYVGVARFANNRYNQANSVFMLPRARPDLYGKVYQHTDFHTHLSDERYIDRKVGSLEDKRRKESMLSNFSQLKKFIIITNKKSFTY